MERWRHSLRLKGSVRADNVANVPIFEQRSFRISRAPLSAYRPIGSELHVLVNTRAHPSASSTRSGIALKLGTCRRRFGDAKKARSSLTTRQLPDQTAAGEALGRANFPRSLPRTAGAVALPIHSGGLTTTRTLGVFALDIWNGSLTDGSVLILSSFRAPRSKR
jgi:hypothetical protein